jgi:hypothetical protein
VLLTGRVTDSLVPTSLGRNFRWLVASSIITNIGDGIALAAGPVLVASDGLAFRGEGGVLHACGILVTRSSST